MSSERELITVSLAPGSLDELLAGQYVSRVWLERGGDEFRLHALHAAAPVLEAIERLVGDQVDGQPPIVDPTPEVAEFMKVWRPWIGPDSEETP